MDTTWLNQHLQQAGELIVFVNVLLQQLGLPVPAVPTLLMAGSLASGAARVILMLLAAVSASVLADLAWYQAGRLFGYRVLALLCRLSINPGSCVNQTEARFVRWGVWSLLVAKFIPGFSTVAPPIAGALRMPLGRFLIASGLGAALWAGLALLAGFVLQSQIASILELLNRHGIRVAGVLGFLLVLWIAWKLWQQSSFRRLAKMPHISPEELGRALASGEPLRIVDLRSAALVGEDGPIPGARVAELTTLHSAVEDWPVSGAVVTLCACPEDASAVHAARTLQAMGYRNVRPLRGGAEAWRRLKRPPG